jgi:hypothetical protein
MSETLILPEWSDVPPTEPGLYRWRIFEPFVYAGFSYYPNKRGWVWVDVAHEYGDPQKPLRAFEPGNPRHFTVANLPGQWSGPIEVGE